MCFIFGVFFFFRESEYQLVAGGEELFQENGLLAHKSGHSRMSPSDVRVKEEYKESQSPFARRSPSDSGDIPSDEDVGFDAFALDLRNEHAPGAFVPPVPFGHPAQQPRGFIKDEACDLHLPFPSSVPPISSVMAPSVSPPHVRNSITAVSLSAAGMRPLLVDVNRYAPPSPPAANSPRVSIYIKLSLSSLHDVSSPPALHGFTGAVTFAVPWTSVAQCVTRVFAGGVCESEEYAYFEPVTPLSPVSVSPVTALLPESELSRCRWGNIGVYMLVTCKGRCASLLTRALATGVQTRIEQLITIDHEELAWITYDLTWTASGPPTAEVLSVQRDSREQQQQQQHHHAAPTPLSEPASFLSLNGWNSSGASSYAPYTSCVPRSQEVPIAYSSYSSFGGSPSGGQHYTHYSSSVLFS